LHSILFLLDIGKSEGKRVSQEEVKRGNVCYAESDCPSGMYCGREYHANLE
jgi:hypothetical protein